MKKDSIHDFVAAWKQYSQEPIDEIYSYQWDRRFKEAGYHPARITDCLTCWDEIHNWCEDQYGNEHYTWTGTTFWFETEQDCILFLLRWS